MKNNSYALKGNILYSKDKSMIIEQKHGFLLCEDGKVTGVFGELPKRFEGIPVVDKGDALILPGFADLHLHAPQYAFRGLGMDHELLDWLDTHTFPEEAKYADPAYAKLAYGQFVPALAAGATTRAVVFATAHTEATLLLMDMLEETGLVTRVGRVNMDRNSNPALQEQSAAASLADTRDWLRQAEGRYTHTAPILTPRFIPSCSDELMHGLAALQKETGLPVQSHLSENQGEIAWVKELCPEAANYADAYRRFGLLGGAGCPTIMAHCVWSDAAEQALLAEHGVWVAHCPVSNADLSSGVAPVRAFLERGIKTGLGSDMAGGYELSIFGVMVQAVKDSKLRWRMQDETLAPLTLPEVFYLATRGGGSFFGQVGAFEPGWEFDAIVVDDSEIVCPFELTLQERLERLVYLGGDRNVKEKYVQGRRVK
ncbi:amidohydrolase family protein [Ruminococcaceae bacterium OttesenSCG-928-D13]|nr:amidohydrolase family protein [Ruminococcaceae bacterium OttesenSCG-928-D13]